MAKSVLEIQEETKNTIKEIAKLQKAANKIAAGKGAGLTQFKFFANKLERFNEVKGNITNVLGFLTNKAARDEARLAEQVGLDLKTFRERQKAARLSQINQALLEKEFEKMNTSGINASEFYNKLSDTQKEQIANDKEQQKKLFKLLGETAYDSNRTQEQQLKAFEEGLSKLNDTQLDQQKQAKEFYIAGVKRENEKAADERAKFDKQKREQPLQKNQPQSTISGRTAGQESDGSGIKDEVIGSSIGLFLGRFLGKGGGFFKAIGTGLMRIPLGITKLLGFAFNPVGLAIIGGTLLFTFKDEISAFLGKAFNFLGKKLASFTKMIGDFFAAPIKLYFKGLKFIGGKILSVFKSIGGFIGKILDGIRNYLSDIPIIGRFFKKKGGDGAPPEKPPVTEEQFEKEKQRVFADTFGVSGDIQASTFSTPTNLNEKLKRVEDIKDNAINKVANTVQPVVTNLVNNAQNVANNTTENIIKSVRNNDPMINAFRNYR